MALTVRTNTTAMSAANQLNATQNSLAGSLNRISTGLRITSAADDAAGLGVATNLSVQNSSLEQAMRNSNDGISMIQTAEGASNEVVNILDRMRELAVQSSSETLANTERAYIQDEYTELSAEVGRIASVTEFNGIQLADGTTSTIGVQVGIQNAASSKVTITMGDLSATTLGVNGLTMSSSTGALAAINAIDTALDTVNGYRSDLGASQNRLDSALANTSTYLESITAAAGNIMDADFAHETSEMTKQQIMQQAGVAALSQAKNMSQSVVTLLT
jgi:flagellin